MNDLIEKLSNLRSQFNCFDENERDAYHTLSEAIKVLSERPEPCEDAVSRADVVDMLEMYPFTEYSEYEAAREVVKRLPSVTPKRKKWKWIECEDNTSFVKQLPRRWIECPECGASYDPGYKSRYLFCPNCGADMNMKGNDSGETN